MAKTHRLASGLLTVGLTANAFGGQSDVMNLDIRAQPLESAITAWARQTRYQVLIGSNHSFDGRATPDISGVYTPEAALKLLLASTDLQYQFVNARTVAIRAGDTAEASPRYIRVAQASVAAAAATTTPAARQAEGSNDRLEEVLVTAEKRSERLQDTPISITAITTEDIEHRGLTERGDYLRSVPGVNLLDQGPGLNTIMIRGVYGDYFSTGPTTGVYLGDVPLTGNALGGTSDVILEDIERIEVLRGPQGTLYGSNALSGAVRYIPRAPDLSKFEARVEAGYSSTSRYGGGNTRVQGILNVPLSDRLAIRGLAYRHENDGFYRNTAGSDPALQAAALAYGAQNLAVNKQHRGGTEYTGGRLSAMWNPVDPLSLTLTYLKQKTTQEDRPFEMVQFGEYQLAEYQLGGPALGKDGLSIDLDVANLTGELHLPWGTLLSSSSWVDQDSVRIWDIGTILPPPRPGLRPPVTQLSTTNAQEFSEEVRFTSALEGPIEFVAGLYYENNKQPYFQPTYFAGDPALNPYAAVKMWDAASGRWVKQKAAFGEASYHITEKLTATVGGRHFKYDTRFKLENFDSVVPFVRNGVDDNKADESGNTFKAGLELKPMEDVLVYGKWSQGFRLGRPLNTTQIRGLCDRDADGFLDGTNVPSTLNMVSSDTLDSYELGTKVTMMSGRAAVSTAVYNNKWDDVPVVFQPPGCLARTTINGGSARARGVELEGSIRPIESLQLGLGVGYVNTKLTATTTAGNDGDRMNFTPKLNGNLSAEYGFTLVGHEAFVRSDYSYYGSYFTRTGEQGDRVGGYGLVNLSTGMQMGPLDLQFQVSNLLNSDAYTMIDAAAFPARYALRLRPRTVGLTVGYKF